MQQKKNRIDRLYDDNVEYMVGKCHACCTIDTKSKLGHIERNHSTM
jgi:hypothetical protein